MSDGEHILTGQGFFVTSHSSSNHPEISLGNETIVLKNHLDDLDRLSDWLLDVAQRYQFSQKLSFHLELVIAEAVTNIIQNAYLDEAIHPIPLRLSLDPETVRVEIRDDGAPFDPLQYPEAALPDSLEDATEGGLGIHLIRSYSRECVYQREGNENVLILLLNREG